jgi:hypothetical protein
MSKKNKQQKEKKTRPAKHKLSADAVNDVVNDMRSCTNRLAALFSRSVLTSNAPTEVKDYLSLLLSFSTTTDLLVAIWHKMIGDFVETATLHLPRAPSLFLARCYSTFAEKFYSDHWTTLLTLAPVDNERLSSSARGQLLDNLVSVSQAIMTLDKREIVTR